MWQDIAVNLAPNARQKGYSLNQEDIYGQADSDHQSIDASQPITTQQ